MPTQTPMQSSQSHRTAPPAPTRLVSISLSSGIGDGGDKTEETWVEQTKYEGGKSVGDISALQIEEPDAAAAAARTPRPRWLSLLLLGLGIIILLSVVGALIASFHNEILDGKQEGGKEGERGRRGGDGSSLILELLPFWHAHPLLFLLSRHFLLAPLAIYWCQRKRPWSALIYGLIVIVGTCPCPRPRINRRGGHFIEAHNSLFLPSLLSLPPSLPPSLLPSFLPSSFPSLPHSTSLSTWPSPPSLPSFLRPLPPSHAARHSHHAL